MSVTFKSETVAKHHELSDHIKESLQQTDGVIKEKESHSAYMGNLPEGITQKDVEELSKYNGKFITATHVAVGELAADAFKANKSLEQVSAEIGYFGKNDSIAISVARSKTYQNHLPGTAPGDEKEVTKQLVMQTTVTSHSAKGYGIKAVREAMSSEFSDMFKK